MIGVPATLADYLPLVREIYLSAPKLEDADWLRFDRIRGKRPESILQPEEIAALENLYDKYRADVVWREENPNV